MYEETDKERLQSKLKHFKEFDAKTNDALIAGRTNLRGSRSADLDEDVITLFDTDLIKDLRTQAGTKPVSVEIGFGKGMFLLDYAKQHKDRLVVGIEVRRSLCNRVIKKAKKQELKNVRIALGDSRELLPVLFPEQKVDEIFVLFPDPWWKKRHAKRRYGQYFFQLLAKSLIKDGILILKSDVQEYLNFLKQEAEATGKFLRALNPEGLPLTNREIRLKNNGFPIYTASFHLK